MSDNTKWMFVFNKCWKGVLSFVLIMGVVPLAWCNNADFSKPSLHEANKNRAPAVIEQVKGFTLWYKQDDVYLVPKTNVYFMLEPATVKMNAEMSAMNILYSIVINEALLPLSSQFRDAGVLYNVHPIHRGLSVSLSGMTKPQPELLEKMLTTIVSNQFTEQQFVLAKGQMERSYQAFQASQPINKVMGEIIATLDPSTWSMHSLHDALAQISLKDLRDYQYRFLSQLQVTGLAHGDLDKKMAIRMAGQIKSMLSIAKNGAVIPPYKVIKLPQSVNWLRLLNEDQPDTAVVIYSQVTHNTLKEIVPLRLLGYMLQSELFNILRTEKSMGYIVGASPLQAYNIDGLAIYAQSPNQTALEIQKELESVLKGMDARIANLSEDDFSQFKYALRSFLTKEVNLKARSDFYWMQIALNFPPYLQKERVIEFINQLSKADFLAFLHGFLFAESSSRLVVYSQHKNMGRVTDDKTQVINNLVEFKGGADYF
ncbi:insulinase family protein [Alkalimarinus alittae]|uniref:Insulinase family protein n=1 Tax=Alkalimarinus alittae TaxID=2961619 RepID=A0ABY6N1D6_9ALTE|nr:insulinase family protein [Alkalimarinus alittae]UZE95923.1 insulinase family protein [Alkalimarinus alittae]